MSELTTRGRARIKDSNFAYVDKSGEGHLPIHDESHIRNAIARWNQTDFGSATAREGARRKIVAAARKHGIDVSPDDNVAKSTHARRNSR